MSVWEESLSRVVCHAHEIIVPWLCAAQNCKDKAGAPGNMIGCACVGLLKVSSTSAHRDAIEAHVEIGVALSLEVVVQTIQQRCLGGSVEANHTGVGHCYLHSSCRVGAAVPGRRGICHTRVLNGSG